MESLSRSLSSSINRFLTHYPVVLSLKHRFLVSHRKNSKPNIHGMTAQQGTKYNIYIIYNIYKFIWKISNSRYTIKNRSFYHWINGIDWFDLKILSGASKSWTNRKIINPVGSLRDIIQSHNGGLLSQYCRFSHFQRSLMLSCMHATGKRSNMFSSSNQEAVFPLQI